jgi:frataxin
MIRRVPRVLSLRPSPSLPRSTRHTFAIARPLLSYTQSQSNQTRKRPFHASATRSKGLSPTSSEPEPPKGEHAGGAGHVAQPAALTTDEYHDLADQYIDALVLKLEEMAEEASEKLEVEYSVCHTSTRPSYTPKVVAVVGYNTTPLCPVSHVRYCETAS